MEGIQINMLEYVFEWPTNRIGNYSTYSYNMTILEGNRTKKYLQFLFLKRIISISEKSFTKLNIRQQESNSLRIFQKNDTILRAFLFI